MADCIDRRAAIDALEREKTYCTAFRDGYTPINVFEKYNAGLTDGIKALKNLPSAQPLSEQDLTEIADRFGGFVRFVVEDMLTGRGQRWEKTI